MTSKEATETHVAAAPLKVPFNKPVWLPEHETIFTDPRLRHCIAGNGEFTKSVESQFERVLGKPLRLVTSATHAMEMMALLIDLAPGDEVIVPSFTFVSTANAFALRGARIRFADNDEFGNILPAEVERLANSKTKAVIAVDYAGASADMDALIEVCRRKNIVLFEDAAQAVGGFYKNKPLGTLGALGCFSFHETKNITSGEGGGLILGDTAYLERAEILREKGTNRARFLQGLADKYTWVDVGSSYVLSELSVAYLEAQVGKIDEIAEKRGRIWNRYRKELASVFARFEIDFLATPAHNRPNYHLFAGVFPAQEIRDSFIRWMRANGIICPFHYVSLHSSPFGARFSDGKPETLKGCERLSRQLVRFPLFYNMTEAQQDFVLEKSAEWVRTQT